MDMHPTTGQRISNKLRDNFVYSDDVARVLTLALRSKENVLLWGPAGHGKSEMVQAALTLVTRGEPVYTLSFGEGMTEDRLWGGVDLAALQHQNVLRNKPEHSFLPHELAVFEELLDAPPVVLLGLKDTLSARELRKGDQRYPMITEVIIAITNKDPREMSALGPAAHALMERFPLQLEVKWPSYTSLDYLQLFELIEPKLDGPPIGHMDTYLAQLLADIGENGEVISPRLARHALKIVKMAALDRGANRVEKIDFTSLRFVPGMNQSAQTIDDELTRLIERKAAQQRLDTAQQRFTELMTQKSDAAYRGDGHAMLDLGSQLQNFYDELSTLRVTDDLAAQRRVLRERVEQEVMEANRLAPEYNRTRTPRY